MALASELSTHAAGKAIKPHRPLMVVIAVALVAAVLLVGLFGLLSKRMGKLIEAQRVDALRQITSLARYTIEPVIQQVKDHKITRQQGLLEARAILHRMLYQDESGANYIFMIGYDGLALAFPYQPEREMKPTDDLFDGKGVQITPLLINAAKSRPEGGIVRYFYPMPGKTNIDEKMTYVVGVPELECLIGTGMYVKSYQKQQAALLETARFWSLMLVFLVVIPIGGSWWITAAKNRQLRHEVAERKHAEAAARFNERRLQALFDAATDVAIVVCEKNAAGLPIIRDFSPGAERLFGYSQAEMAGQPDTQLFPPAEVERVRQLDATLSAGKAAVRTDAHIRTKAGKELFSQLSTGVLDSQNEEGQTLVRVFVDVTERVMAERALKRSEAWWRTALDNLPFEVWTLDTAGRYEIQNRQSVAQSGNLIGKPFQEAPVAPALRVRWEAINRRALSGENCHGECAQESPGGKLYFNEILSPIREGEDLRGVLGVRRDITEQRRAEAERARLETQLRQSQKLEAIGTLAAGIAHEFNNLLATILSGTELAKQGKHCHPEIDDNLERVVTAAHRARDLVRQILAFNRQSTAEKTVISLVPLVKEGVKFLRATLPSTIDIVSDIAENAPSIMGDPTQIHQILMNLCANAAQAMEGKPGLLTISLTPALWRADQRMPDPEMPAGAYLKLAVRDNGHGMTEEVKRRLFEPFFTTRSPGEGSGLGLPVVHGIVKSHQGFIAVQSQPQAGACFELYFPVAQTSSALAAVAAGKPDSKSMPAGGGQRIMLVDDEAAVLMLLERVLKRLGYQVRAFAKPREALEGFKTDPQEFDLLLTDFTMPGMTGIDLAKAVHAIRPDLPVILSSGFTGAYSRESMPETCRFEVINKPASMQELAQALNKVFEGHPQPAKVA